jgi:cell division septum initiation protein DivIVA
MAAVSDFDLLVPPGSGRMREREFDRVRSGYDPDQVHEYLGHVDTLIESLEKDLREARAQYDAVRHRLASARQEAYDELAGRMAEVLRTADQEAEKARSDAEQEAKWRVAEARTEAERLRREANDDLERIQQEGEHVLRTVREEVDSILGDLADRRNAMLRELREMQEHLKSILEQLAEVTAAPAAPSVNLQPLEAWTVSARREPQDVKVVEGHDPHTDELLTSTEGFDLILPDFSGEDDAPS